MLFEQPFDDMAEIVVWGNPWHGIVNGGTLDTGLGVTREWTQPDSGDCFLVKPIDNPAVERSTEQLAWDADQGHHWRDYAFLTGWRARQLYGMKMSEDTGSSNRMFVFAPGAGACWKADLRGLAVSGSTISGNITFSRLQLSSTEQQTVSATHNWTAPSNCNAMEVMDVTPDGSKAILGIFRQDSGTSLRWHNRATAPISRGMAYSGNSFGVIDGNYMISPHVFLLLETSIDGDGMISCTITTLKAGQADLVQSTSNNETEYSRLYYSARETSSNVWDFDVRAGAAPGGFTTYYETTVPALLNATTDETRIIDAYFKNGVVKYVTLSVTSDFNFTSEAPIGASHSGIFTVAPDDYFQNHCFNGTSLPLLVPTTVAQQNGTIKTAIKFDGVEVSAVTKTWEATGALIQIALDSDSPYFVAPSYALDDGGVDLDSTTVIAGSSSDVFLLTAIPYASMQTASPSLYGLSLVTLSWPGHSAVIHPLRFCTGCYGFAVRPDASSTWKVGAGASVVTNARGAAVGDVTPPSGGIQWIYSNVKMSHHPVTGDILVNAGSWV